MSHHKIRSIAVVGILVVGGYLIIHSYYASKHPGLSITQFNKKVSTEGTHTAEIVVDTGKVIPQPGTGSQERTEVESGNEEIIAKIEALPEDDNLKKIADDLPAEINLAIPFFPQAPDADRSLPRKEGCEEASTILAAYYMNNQPLSKEQFKKDFLALVEREKQLFGSDIDTNLDQIRQLYDDFYGIGTAEIIEDPTIDQIKSELVQGHPIIAPFAGKLLGNSYFTNGGPRYHVLVIRGYDEKYFYTNDVGTKRGENFPYTYETIMRSLHDFVKESDGEMTDGAKRILVLRI